jgi:hypothetical protein
MPYADFTFSGSTKLIYINPGVTVVDVQEMYSSWKLWSTETDNTKYLGAFRTFGGDPTIPGQFAPRYYFLINGWQVVVQTNEDVNFGTNLYTDAIGTSPFIVGSGSSVTNRNSDAVVVDDPIAQAIDYGGEVNVNPSIGVTGTTYPIGTLGLPVSNMIDAKSIATSRGIYRYNIYGTVTGNTDIHDSVIYGGNITDKFIFPSNYNFSGTTFQQTVLEGTQFGSIAANNCIISDGYSGMSGVFQNCGIRGDVYFEDGITCDFFDGASQIPGNNSPQFFMGNDINLSVRRWSGGISWYDIRTGTTVTVEYVAGNCNILTGCTGGEIEVRGISKFTDESSGTTVGTYGLLVPIDVAQQHTLNVNTEVTKNK